MKPHEDHRAKSRKELRVRVVTSSSSRYAKKVAGEGFTDEGGDAAEAEAKQAGLVVASRELVSDDEGMLKKAVDGFLSGGDDVLIITGGTGISRRDVTIETVKPYFEKELEGFGEIFRSLSYQEVGSAAILTRAAMGVARGKLIVCVPGSPNAVRTALRAFAKEFPHALFVASG